MTVYAQSTQTHPWNDIPNEMGLFIQSHGLGISRTGTKGKRWAGMAYGHDIPLGRAVVYSAQHNLTNAHSPHCTSVSLPDASGDYTNSEINNLPLSHADNAELFAALKPDGEYCFAGFVVHVDNCPTCECSPCYWESPACPVGNPDLYIKYNYAPRKTTLTYTDSQEYLHVFSAVALKKGDKLAIVDDPGDDPCVNLLGAVTLAGQGGFDLPDYYEVVNKSEELPTGGHCVEIRIRG